MDHEALAVIEGAKALHQLLYDRKLQMYRNPLLGLLYYTKMIPAALSPELW